MLEIAQIKIITAETEDIEEITMEMEEMGIKEETEAGMVIVPIEEVEAEVDLMEEEDTKDQEVDHTLLVNAIMEGLLKGMKESTLAQDHILVLVRMVMMLL